ncbi:MAG: polysaccharide pyruvyl transferase family protein, partial [Candidatus Paceibacterota bacterium]
LRDQIIYKKTRAAGCDWKNRGVTLTSKGELAYCAVQSRILGDAKDEDSNDLYWENSDHLKDIVNNECATCHHDYEGFSDRKLFVKSFAKEVIQKLPNTVGEGIDKTIDKFKKIDHSLEVKKIMSWSKGVTTQQKDLVPNQVLICGWYGTETLGDKAILGGIVNKIKESDNNTIVHLASLEPYVSEMTTYQMKELGINKVIGIKGANEKICSGSYESVIMGGGPLMSSVSEVTQILELFTNAKKVGAKNIIWGCGIGPLFDGHTNNKVIKQLLNLSDKIYVRDSASQELLSKELGINKPTNVSLDPAFEWIMNNKSSEVKRNSKQIILALRDWPIQEYASDLNEKKALKIKKSFEQQVQGFVSTLLESDDEIKIIPFCMHKYATGGDDRFFYKRLFKDFPEVLENLDMQHRTPLSDLKLFQKSSFVLAMRYHSTVFSIATGTPFMSIDYTRGGKITGLLQDMSLNDRLIDLDSFDGKMLAENFNNISEKTFDRDGLIKEQLTLYNELLNNK